MANAEIQRHFKVNFVMGVLDGCFFGLALGLASYVTILPLFVSYLTDSTILIGLIATIHMLGWQLPQLLTAHRVSKLKRIKPMVFWMTLHERLPYFGLALVALFLPAMTKNLALVLTILILSWQSIGGGFTGTPWQSMISKVIPQVRRGTFYGIQSSGANLLGSGGAVVAGLLLGAIAFPNNYAFIFLLAGLSMMISLAFLMLMREPETEAEILTPETNTSYQFWDKFRDILQHHSDFRWFLVARSFSQFSVMAMAFYTIFAVRTHDMSPKVAGTMTAVLFISQTVSSPILGWLGDRVGHRVVFAFGNLLMAVSAGLALYAPSLDWFYAVFAVTGIVSSTQWTSILALSSEFGSESERPLYIGMSNTLIAPATLIAPIFGGWLADSTGFNATFGVAIFFGVLTAIILLFLMRDPIQRKQKFAQSSVTVGD
ncbi:MAG: MFS transporter [Anaerolineae bacterium]|nr:MFS transporter [Anaerolineae bacterium]